MTDIVITWPKKRTLRSYLDELRKAQDRGYFINYRVPSKPKAELAGGRCYVVHSGSIVGWNHIIEVIERGENEVLDASGDEYWPAGWYVVRDPRWHDTQRFVHRMEGFQGYRYADFAIEL